MIASIVNDEISDDPKIFISLLKKARLKRVELRSINGKNILDLEEKQLESLLDKLNKNRIKVSAIASPLFKWYPLNLIGQKEVDTFHFSPYQSKESMCKYIDKAIYVAKKFGTKNLRIFSCLTNNKLRKYDFISDPIFLYALKKAEENNILLLLENEPVCYIYKKKDILNVINEVKSKNFGIWLDIANLYRTGERITYLDIVALKNKIFHLHFKDIDEGNNYVVFGEGRINYKRIVSDLSDILINKNVCASLEVHIKGASEKQTLKSIRNLKKTLNTKRVSYAIVGCGRIFSKHANAIKKDENSELKIVYDINKVQASSGAINFDCELAKSFEEIIQNPRIHVVNICTPHDTHKELVQQTISSGKYCLCEKPLALTVEDCTEITNNKNSSKVIIAFQNRFNKPVDYMLRAINMRKLGTILSCTVTTRWWRDINYFLDDWHGDLKKVGGMLFNQNPHVVDLMVKICGKAKTINGYAVRTRKNIQIDDIVVANIHFMDGAVGLIEANTLSKDQNYENSIFVLGTKGCMKVGGPSLSKVEYMHFEDNDNNLLEIQDDIYGNGHNEVVKSLSKLVLKGTKDYRLVGVEEATEVTRLISEIYKSIKFVN